MVLTANFGHLGEERNDQASPSMSESRVDVAHHDPGLGRTDHSDDDNYMYDDINHRLECDGIAHERRGLLQQEDRKSKVDDADILLSFTIRNSFLYRCIITSAFGSLLLGFDLGIISGALIPLQNDLSLTDTQLQFVTSSIIFTSIIGSLVAGVVADRLGRKVGLLAAALIFLGGSIGMASSFSFGALLLWRCVTGIAVGMGLVICPIFCAELAPRRERGRLTSFNEMFINVGIPLAYLVGLLLRGIENDWRYMLASGSIPAILLAIMVVLMPESPAYLLKQKKLVEAAGVIEQLVDASESQDTKDRVVRQTMLEMGRDMQSQKEMASWGEMFTSRETRSALFVGLTFSILTQLPGIDSIIFYSVHTLSNFGADERLALKVTLGMGLCKLTFTCFAALLVDNNKVGRRLPVIVGGFFGVISMGIMAAAGLYGHTVVTERMIITGMLMFVSAFGFGYGPMCWLILAEIFHGPYRSKGMALGSVVNRLGSFTIASTYLSLVSLLGYGGTFSVYVVIGIVSLSFSCMFVPDLTGKTMGIKDGSDHHDGTSVTASREGSDAVVADVADDMKRA